MVSESLSSVVDIGVEEFLQVGVVESGVEVVPVGVFAVPDVACVIKIKKMIPERAPTASQLVF